MKEGMNPTIAGILGGLMFLGGVMLGGAWKVNEYRECRMLVATGDSATVMRLRPQCQTWTKP
jgi:hypothetical protein